MPSAPAEYEPPRLADEAERFWKSRQLPPANGVFGPSDGPILHQFEGGIVGAEEASFVAYRAVAADVDARYALLSGRRCDGTLRWRPAGSMPDELAEAKLLRKLAIWTGGTGSAPWDTEDRREKVERLVGRLARRGVIVSRDLPLRFCPTCVAPRSPERIIYQEEVGDTYLIRFEIPLDGRSVNALVWVDAPWRLLGASALLVHPEAPYVVARYRRKDSEELILTSRSSLERFRDWIPGATFELVEERPGREFAGRAYVYPLRHEFPMGGELSPPGGTVLAATDVTGTGTGIVMLVPGHGSTDAVIAESLGVAGWPLVTPKGLLDVALVHKYAGLDLKTASEFVLRDLSEGNLIFADLKVHRGVPHCTVCGTALIWFPGRAWCLEPGRLPPEVIELYRRLLPGAPPLHRVEVAPWPVSETSPSDDPGAVALLECNQCERLGALDGPATCHCGGTMFATRRRLVASADDAFSAWARHDPFPSGDSVRLYVGERRRVPAVVHHLAGLASVEGTAAAVALSVLPTLPEVDLGRLVETEGSDAVRAALVRSEGREGTASTFPERCAQERHRLERLWAVANELLAQEDPETLASYLEPISEHLAELETEDRALLARWERTRVATIADGDRGSIASAHRRVFRFLETDLADYRRWTRDRSGPHGGATPSRGVRRTLGYVLRTAAVLLGPIVPCTADAIFRRLTGDRRSLFETGIGAVERTLLDEHLYASWDRWHSFLEAVAAFRRAHAIHADTTLPRAAIVLATDEEGDRLREGGALLERLGRIARLEIASPREPWTGRRRTLRPIESEIQRVYPAQASQIAHLLRRMPSRRSGDLADARELSFVIQGLPRPVLPSMVDYLETLPEGMVPSPWRLGELYVEIPGSGRAHRPTAPPLSPDAFWLVRHVERRLRRSRGARDRAGLAVVVSATDPLASELRGVTEPLARYLDVSEVRVPETISEAPPAHRTRGRTKTGARWWVDIPGLPPPIPRHKGRIVRAQRRRVPARRARPADTEPEIDYSDEKVISEEEAVRALNRELDSVLRHASVGPSKVRAAWDRGFRDLERYRGASYDELLELPGFSGGVAEGLVLAFGGSGALPSRSPVPNPASPGRAPLEAEGAVTTRPSESAAGTGFGELSPAEPSPVAQGDLSSAVPPPLPARPEPVVLAPPPVPSPERSTTSPSGEMPPQENSPEPISEPSLPRPGETVRPIETSAPLPVPEEVVPVPIPEAPIRPHRPPEPPRASPVPPGAGYSPETVTSVVPPEDGAIRPEEPRAGEATLAPIRSPGPEAPASTAGESPPIEIPVGAATLATFPPMSPTSEAGSEDAPGPAEPLPAEGEVAEPQAASPDPLPDLSPGSSGRTGTSDSASVEFSPEVAEAPARGSLEPLTDPVPRSEPPAAEVVSESPPEPSRLGLADELPGRTPSSEAPDATPLSEEATTPEGQPGPSHPTEGALVEPGPGPGEEAPLPSGAGVEETTGSARHLPSAPAEPSGPRESPPSALGSVMESPEVDAGPEPGSLPAESLSGEESVPPPPTNEVGAPPVSGVPQGGIEVMVGASVVASLQPFLEATAAGLKGICVIRESPERIRAQAGGRPVEIYWLTNMARDRTLRPNDLPGFATFLTRAIDEDRAQLFFIEGVEYLAHIHGVEAVIGNLSEFDRLAKEREVRVWLHVTPGLMRPGELERLLEAFRTAP